MQNNFFRQVAIIISICVILLISLSSNCGIAVSAEIPDGFGDVKFGMSKDEVLSILRNKNTNIVNEDAEYIICTDTVMGERVKIAYRFTVISQKCINIAISFNPDAKSKIEQTMINKYGSPFAGYVSGRSELYYEWGDIILNLYDYDKQLVLVYADHALVYQNEVEGSTGKRYPENGQVDDGISHKGINVSYNQVSAYIKDYFIMKKALSVHGSACYRGETTDQLAFLQIIGNDKENIERAILEISLPKEIPAIMARNALIYVRFLANIFPDSREEVLKWADDTIRIIQNGEGYGVERMFGEKKILIRYSIESISFWVFNKDYTDVPSYRTPPNSDTVTVSENYNGKVEGIMYSKNKPSVIIDGKIYYINDLIYSGKIVSILPNKILIRFGKENKAFGVGDSISESELKNQRR